MTEYALFDASSYLDSEEMIAEYLTAAAEDENPDVMLLAIANVAKARGMTHVAKAAGLSRESLYKTLAPGAHPRFRTPGHPPRSQCPPEPARAAVVNEARQGQPQNQIRRGRRRPKGGDDKALSRHEKSRSQAPRASEKARMTAHEA
jgi:probable addiction module antidote protein